MLPPEDLADLVAECVQIATRSLVERIKTLEARPVVMSMEPRDGRDGKDGIGIIGPQGERGEKGMDGAIGTNGKDGANGLNGADGATGAAGKDGANGRDGIGVVDALLTKDGSLVLTLSDGTTRTLGSVMGPAGPQGERGVSIIGEQGPQGERGMQGEKGDRGSDGPVGQRGPLGEKGEQGQQGADGAQGERGIPGKDGAVGINGKDAIFDSHEIDAIRQSVADVKATVAAIPRDVSPEEAAQQFADMLKRELDAITPPTRMQKRVIRDAHGRIEKVVEEPVSR